MTLPLLLPGERLKSTLTAAVGPVALIALVLPYLFQPEVRVDFDEDGAARLAHTRGIYGPEHTREGFTFAWTSENARLVLPALPRTTAWTLTLRARAPRPGDAQAAPVTFAERGEALAVWAAPPRESQGFAEFVVPLPASSDEGLRLDITSGDSFVPGPRDNRSLALQIDWIVLRPESRWSAIPIGRPMFAALALAMLAWLVLIVTDSLAAGACGVAAAVAIGGLGRRASWLYLPSFDNVYWAAVPVIAILAIGLLLRWVWRVPRQEAGAAIAITAWFTVVKFALVIHPAMTIGDTGFHQNRFQLVHRDTYLFTSVAPGGEFPYAPAFYVALKPFASGPVASPELLRGFAVALDSAAGLVLALAIATSSHRLLAPAAALLWQTAPALFQVHALTYLTNAFGNAWSAIAMAFLVRTLRERQALVWLTAAVAATTIAFLSHVSSLLMLVLALAGAVVMALLRRRWRPAALIGATLAVSLAIAWVAYYRHFTPLYAQRLSAPAAAPLAPDAPLPVQRDEAHQTVFHPGWPALQQRLAFVPRYTVRYVGIGLLGLALLWPWARRGSPAIGGDAAVLAWGCLAATAAAFVAGQLTPVDLRYYLVGASLAVVVGAATVAASWSSGSGAPAASPALRGAVAVLTLVAVAQGCWYMARFLWYPLIR